MTPIFDALVRHAHDRPDAVAFREGDRGLTWSDLAIAVSRTPAGFAAGPRCVGLALAGLDYVIGDLAATVAGCRVVPGRPSSRRGRSRICWPARTRR